MPPTRTLQEILTELGPPGQPADYQYKKEIGCGSEGNVLSATWKDGGDVAVKVVRVASASMRKHVTAELQIGLGLLPSIDGGADHLAKFHCWYPGIGGIEREVHMVLEICEFSLDEFLRTAEEVRACYERHRRMSGRAGLNSWTHRMAEGEIVLLMLHMLRALALLNENKVMHRDVKAENILWQEVRHQRSDFPSPHGVYKLCDFGVARRFGEGEKLVCSEKVVVGTLWTTAPEVLQMEAYTENCDVWSLGCVLWEMMYLQKPFRSSELLALQTGKLMDKGGLKPGGKEFGGRVLKNIYDPLLQQVVDLMLQPARKRPAAHDLLRHPLVHQLLESQHYCGPPLPAVEWPDMPSPTSSACVSPTAADRRTPKRSTLMSTPLLRLPRTSPKRAEAAELSPTSASTTASSTPAREEREARVALAMTGMLYFDAVQQYRSCGELPVYKLMEREREPATDARRGEKPAQVPVLPVVTAYPTIVRASGMTAPIRAHPTISVPV